MNYLKHLNQENIDAWNKENPEETFSYDECAKDLEQLVHYAASGIIQGLIDKEYQGRFYVEPEYISEGSEAVNWTGAISLNDFSDLVLKKISSITNREES